MNKKGFTLIEIIICIALIVVIGTISVIGVNIALKNIRINKLKDIEEEIMTAATIYLETNSIAQAQLYNQGNAVVVPLNVLVNEGLLDLSNTDLDEDDIKDEYVLTGRTTTQTDSNGCVNITSTASWNMSDENPLYICTKSDGSMSLQGSGAQVDNISMAKREPYYLDVSRNYAIYGSDKNTIYRLLYIDIDDSMILIKKDSFGEVFKGKTLKISHYDGIFRTTCTQICSNSVADQERRSCWKLEYEYSTQNVVSYDYETAIDVSDLARYADCSLGRSGSGGYNTYKTIKITSNGILLDGNYTDSTKANYQNYYKLRLKPCMKIVGGSGDRSNPFVIDATGECKN